ncbi:MAG: glycosyltransferase family 4 protein [Desulfobaccales bacterium]
MGKSEDYAWSIDSHDEREGIFTLFPGNTFLNRSALRIGWRAWCTLNRINADFLAICGYQGAFTLMALLWAKMHGKIAVMMSDSSYGDQTRSYWREWGKRQIVSRFDAALVAGRRQKEYAAFLGIPAKRIFLGYDVVDNEHFSQEAAVVRQKAEFYRQQGGLPQRYFLTVSRFIGKKNLPFLLEAYMRYRRMAVTHHWDLVLCGSGPMEAGLREQAGQMPGVHFPGFKQASELPIYYGLASTFIIPSSHNEQWGLVVNEAMACGLPVLVSRACGCAQDLVQEGVNGFTFDPHDVDALARLLLRISSGQMDLAAMGQASRNIISAYTPETFAANLLAAIKNSLAALGRKAKNQGSEPCDFSV